MVDLTGLSCSELLILQIVVNVSELYQSENYK